MFKSKKALITLISVVILAVVLVLCSALVRGPETHVCHECDGDGCEVCE